MVVDPLRTDDDEAEYEVDTDAVSVVSCLCVVDDVWSKEKLIELVGVMAISSSSRSSAMSCSTWLSSAAEVARLLHSWPEVDNRVDWWRTGGGGGVVMVTAAPPKAAVPGFGDLGG